MLTVVAHLKTDYLVVLVEAVAGITQGHQAAALELLGKAMLAAQMLIHLQTHTHLEVAEVLALLAQMLFLIVLLVLVELELFLQLLVLPIIGAVVVEVAGKMEPLEMVV
jgi:hypothetical protein